MAHVTKYATANKETYEANAGNYYKSNCPVLINRVMMSHPTHTTENKIMEECENWIKGDEEDEAKARQASCSERSVQPARKKTPRVKLTKDIPSSPSAGNRQEERNKNISLVQQSAQIKIAQTIHHNNHNHCFIKSHDKVLDKQQTEY
jgi:hypothetical protein